MKKLTNFILPIEIGISLDQVESVLFKFVQWKKSLLFSYPSKNATRKDNSNVILLHWTLTDTLIFTENIDVEMDTYIRLVDTKEIPETAIKVLKMNRTLFEECEVNVDD